VVNMHVADTTEAAFRVARPGHDELRKLIWPNTVKKNPALANQSPPSLEDSVGSGAWLVGSLDSVREQLVEMQSELGVEYLTIFPHFPGMTQRDTLVQLERFHAEIMPALSESDPC
jgi:alkanesulfonate monooxygenase SsuD/methylene tetrahydromethanopterin reductase-like flavin-dependent oxidoreductase (luciferase family)